jgi:hypothetical protein
MKQEKEVIKPQVKGSVEVNVSESLAIAGMNKATEPAVLVTAMAIVCVCILGAIAYKLADTKGKK